LPSQRLCRTSRTLANSSKFRHIFSLDDSFRPVPLNVVVRGCGPITNEYIFDKSLNKHIAGTIGEFCDGLPAFVFCHSKKDCETMAVESSKDAAAKAVLFSGARNYLREMSSKTSTQPLSNCLLAGVAYYHAGLDPDDRQLVEQAFSSFNIRVLFATSTLAMGVNLPARLVVVKGTRLAWRGNILGHTDIDSATLLQMIGRAGRPGFDAAGTAVILTDNGSRHKFDSMSGGMDIVESQLSSFRLTETINADIAQKVVIDIPSALIWLKGTFFFIRMKRNPKQYNLTGRDATRRLRLTSTLL
jgi:ATP-dependent DNA helicase HFM1/MER3